MTASPIPDLRAKAAYAALPLLIFGIFFYFVVLQQTQGMRLIPGDLGDARLNMYFLEHIYKVVTGKAASFWQFGFYHPYPYILGMSDNLYGASPVYLTARFAGADPYTSFQVWIMVGFAANFAAAYWALRRLGASSLGASVGAVIFTFALPAIVRIWMSHSQLQYRFGMPLAIAAFILFLERKDWRELVAAVAWTVWQFWCAIYLGFFLALGLLLVLVTYIAWAAFAQQSGGLRAQTSAFVGSFRVLTMRERAILAGLLLALVAAMIILMFPYLRVTQIYDARRPIEEIAAQLPRPLSYLISDRAGFWGSFMAGRGPTQIRTEHQMFLGFTPIILAAAGFVIGGTAAIAPFRVMLVAGMVAGLVTMTLFVGGQSLWLWVASLPLVSAFRVMTRIDLLLLFAAGFLAAIAIDALRIRASWAGRLIAITILPAMLLEFSLVGTNNGSKEEWRARIAATEQRLPPNLPADSILFLSQGNEPWFVSEIDAMWAGVNRNLRTLNGYNGTIPPGARENFGIDCAEAPRRVLSALALAGEQHNSGRYKDIMRRVVPIGFVGCDPSWLDTSPSLTRTSNRIEPAAFSGISYGFEGWQTANGRRVAAIRINNAGTASIPALSARNRPVKLSWRSFDAQGALAETWDLNRYNLPFDIPAGGSLLVHAPVSIPRPLPGGRIEVSLVQELDFWIHDVGVPVLTLPVP